MRLYLHKKMDDRIVSTAVLTLSRQQEEFLAQYRTHEAQKAYFESYGLGVTPFFRGGGGSHGVIPPAPEPEFPYDYEVEYIEAPVSDKRVYLPTNVDMSGFDYELYFDFMPLGYFGLNATWFRAVGQNVIDRYRFFRVNETDQFRINFSGTDSSVFFETIIPLNQKHHVEIFGKEGYAMVNDKRITFPVNSESYAPNLCFFSNYGTEGTSTVLKTFGRLYFVQLYKNGTLILDLIPVSKYGIGYMYDKISGNLLGASGSGHFVLGPRKY